MRTKLQVIAFAVSSLFIFQSQAQTADSGFPKGELSTAKNHTGNIWLSELNVGDSTFDPSIAMATYDAGAKLDWHIHPGGQVLLITEGTGFYQERGKPARIVHKGDVIKCAPGVEHWHGASPGSGFAYIAVTPTQKGKTIWLEPVSDKDYNSGEMKDCQANGDRAGIQTRSRRDHDAQKTPGIYPRARADGSLSLRFSQRSGDQQKQL